MTDRRGAVLLLVLLLILVSATLGLAVLATGSRELHLARALERRARARTAAESAVRSAVQRWSTRYHRRLPVPGEAPGAPGPDGRSRVSVTRLDSTLYLVRGEATVDAGRYSPAVARAGLLVRTPDPGRLAAAFDAAVTADSLIVAGSGTVDGFGVCGGGAAVPGLRAPEVRVAGASVSGQPPVEMAPGPALPPFLSRGRVAALATRFVPGTTASPRPVSADGVCVPGPDNWGSSVPDTPCFDLLPLVLAEGDLGVFGGEGRGALVVQGDLRLDGIRFEGVVVATGRTTIGPGASVQGAVRAPVVSLDGGSVRYDRCAVNAAMLAGGLDRAFRPDARMWVPVF